MLGADGPLLTPAEARALQDRICADGRWLVWFVGTDRGRPGKVVAWAVTADQQGGTHQPGVLIADTLGELRAMLPAGLIRQDRTPFMPAEVAETWD